MLQKVDPFQGHLTGEANFENRFLRQSVLSCFWQNGLNYSEIGMTLNIYSHVLPSRQEEAAQKLDEIITPIDMSDELKKLKKMDPGEENHLKNE